MKSEDKLLREQIEYYRARAPEYDDWFYRRDRYDRGEEHRAPRRYDFVFFSFWLSHVPPARFATF